MGHGLLRDGFFYVTNMPFCNCSLGRVALMLTSVFTAADRVCQWRALPEDYNNNVILIGEDTALAMAASVVSVPGLAFGNNRGL